MKLDAFTKALKKQEAQGGLAQDAARRIQVIFDKELDQNHAIGQVAELAHQQFYAEGKLPFFVSCLQILLEKESSELYAGLSLAAPYWYEQKNPEYRDFLIALLERSAKGHWYRDMPDHKHEDSNKFFSTYAYVLGESFIQLVRDHANNYEIISDLYSYLIKHEMELDRQRLDGKATGKPAMPEPNNPKKLYDDLYDYINERSVFRTDSLSTENPNEFIQILADRLQSTRRYCIQEEINRQALRRKKEMELALKDREASAEEIIFAQRFFPGALELYAKMLEYNIRYFEMEKKRVTFQIIPILLITSLLGLWLMELVDLSVGLAAGLVTTAILIKLLLSKTSLKGFYPKDVTEELEDQVSKLSAILYKCSPRQLESLLRRQSKKVLTHPQLAGRLPDFVRYVYQVMPRKREALTTKEDLERILDRTKYFIARELRPGQKSA